MTVKPLFHKLFVYALLITGTVIFSIPFVWMATTSVKMDRELFVEEFNLLPISPEPRPYSPFVDTQYYEHLEGPFQPVLIPAFSGLARDTGFKMPTGIDTVTAYYHLGRGLYDRMWRSLPSAVWDLAPAQIITRARREVDRNEVNRIFNNVARQFSFSQIRVRSTDLVVQELGADTPVAQRLDNETPDVVTVRPIEEAPQTYTLLNYDFSNGDRIVLSKVFDLDFDAADLQRIQLHIRPDDSWHELWLTVERNGIRYSAERALSLGNFTWMTATWQTPGPDDVSNKIKTWTLLHEAAHSPDFISDPRRVKLTFEIRRNDFFGAWWSKLRFNYHRVLDHIPLWDYTKTSLFLVVVSIGLTLVSCSLVAYAFARLQWPGREVCFVLMLATMMIPPQVTMIPHFLIWKSLGAYDTLLPLWGGHAFGNAFFIFLLRQFMKGIPRDLEDSARIDGCGFLRIYWHIILPLIKPSLATIAIFTFMATWNDFMGPLIYIADQRLYPLAFGLYAFAVQVNNNPALTMAAGLIMTLPVIVLFFFAQRYFIQGATLTGMKG